MCECVELGIKQALDASRTSATAACPSRRRPSAASTAMMVIDGGVSAMFDPTADSGIDALDPVESRAKTGGALVERRPWARARRPGGGAGPAAYAQYVLWAVRAVVDTVNMAETIVAVGTRKGLWIARSADRQEWSVEGPHFLLSEVALGRLDHRAGRRSVLAGVKSSRTGARRCR